MNLLADESVDQGVVDRLRQEGHDVVYGVLRRRAGDPLWRRWSAQLAYWLIERLADVPITPNPTDFRLLSRRAIDALNELGESNRYLRGMAEYAKSLRTG